MSFKDLKHLIGNTCYLNCGAYQVQTIVRGCKERVFILFLFFIFALTSYLPCLLSWYFLVTTNTLYFYIFIYINLKLIHLLHIIIIFILLYKLNCIYIFIIFVIDGIFLTIFDI